MLSPKGPRSSADLERLENIRKRAGLIVDVGGVEGRNDAGVVGTERWQVDFELGDE